MIPTLGFFAVLGWYGPLLPIPGVCVRRICVDRPESKMADFSYGADIEMDENQLKNAFY